MRVDSAVEGSIVGATDMSNELMTSAGKFAFSSAPTDMRARSAKYLVDLFDSHSVNEALQYVHALNPLEHAIEVQVNARMCVMLCSTAASNYDGTLVDTKVCRRSQASSSCENVDIMI